MSRTSLAALVLSASGLVAIALSEGYTDKAVIPIPGDVPTIGFGTTDGVSIGDTTTPPIALQRALHDTHEFENGLKTCVTAPMAQYEYDAYVALMYNIGAKNFCASTLVRKLNAGDYEGACLEILRWNRKNGQVLKGLVARREREYQQCIGR